MNIGEEDELIIAEPIEAPAKLPEEAPERREGQPVPVTDGWVGEAIQSRPDRTAVRLSHLDCDPSRRAEYARPVALVVPRGGSRPLLEALARSYRVDLLPSIEAA